VAHLLHALARPVAIVERLLELALDFAVLLQVGLGANNIIARLSQILALTIATHLFSINSKYLE